MLKRMAVLFVVFLFAAGGLMIRLLLIAAEPEYLAAAQSQSTYRLEVAATRGRIYDRYMRSLAGGRIEYRAMIAPSQQTTAHLTRMLEPDELAAMSGLLTGRSPFVWVVDSGGVEGEGVTVVTAEKRYSANSVAVHTVGYTGADGHGVTGIELAYDDYLAEAGGEITAVYTIDAAGGTLAGAQPEVTDTTWRSRAGVVLTLDVDMQQMVESVARKYIERGAVVVMDAQTGEIRAAVSLPDYRQYNVAASLEAENSPLFNRLLAAYDVGSVFKPVVAAAALEAGISPDRVYCCEGAIDIGGTLFHCSNRSGHGELTMSEAMAVSCNTYFIDLAREVGGERILEMAKRMGFGGRLELADSVGTASGSLPDAAALSNPAALANLSFGQGALSATPVHVALLMSIIASDGMRSEPTLLVGLADSDGVLTDPAERAEPTRVISEHTAKLLREFLRLAVTDGTAAGGEGEMTTAAAKTGTAQTGIVEGGRSILQAWYAGYFPHDQPKWVCVVLVEDGQSGSASASPVFRELADALYRAE